MNVIKCQCGAVTVEGEDFTNSMRPATFRREFPGVQINRKRTYSSCDHCVNHWGIDLCGCGSGQPIGKCDGTFYECRNNVPAQTKGEMKESGIAAMMKRGGF